MVKATLNFEHKRPTTISVDLLVLVTSQRGHGQCIVIIANVVTKLFAYVLLAREKMEKLWWWIIEFGNFNLSTVTAHAKFRRVGQLLRCPVQSPTVRTCNIHFSHIMNSPILVKRLTCQRQRRWGRGIGRSWRNRKSCRRWNRGVKRWDIDSRNLRDCL